MPPALLVSASHGVAVEPPGAYQRERQGALLTSDWPGPVAGKDRRLTDEQVFAAADVPTRARFDGLIHLHVGCFGAGTPRVPSLGGAARPGRAEHDFVARLPQRLLAQGALAVVGHVDESWAYAYLGLYGGERLECHESLLLDLVAGKPIGAAMDPLNRRYAVLGHAFGEAVVAVLRHGRPLAAKHLSRLWTAKMDARSTILLGDPAVRLARA